MTAWIVVVALGIATVALKAAGPVVLGGRELPRPVTRVLALIAPALLAALVVTQTLTAAGQVTVDLRLAGVAAAAVAVALRAPLLVVVAVAAVVTALLRVLVG